MWSSSTFSWPEYLYQESLLEAIFDDWIQTMQDAKVDLLEYTQREAQAWKALGPGWYSGKAPAQSSLWLRPYHVESLICGSRPNDCGFTIRRERVFHVWQEREMPGSWLSGVRDLVGNIIVTVADEDEDEDPGDWRIARRISILSNPVDIRPSRKRDKMGDVWFCNNLQATQDDAGPLALGNLWRQKNYAQHPRRRSRSSPPQASNNH